MLAIDVAGLVVDYGTVRAVDGLCLQARKGEVLVVLGPNGAGKTTTVEVCEGYRRPTAGSVRVLGLDPARDGKQLNARIGVMLQRGGVYPAMTPAQVLALFATYYDNPVPPGDLIATVGLTRAAKTPWRRLSGGEQQRLSLALALIGRPEVAFLDEPTAGVDPDGRLAIRAIVERMRDTGVCVVVTTHELAEAERLADRLVILDAGRAVAEGTPAEITAAAPAPGGQSAASGVRFSAPEGIDTGALGAALGSPVEEVRPGRYRIDGHDGDLATLTAALAAWLAERRLALTDLHAGGAGGGGLEEAYLRITAASAQSRHSGNGGSP